MTNPTAEALLAAADALRARLDALTFTPPATHVYNPLDYARDVHARWLHRYATGARRVIFLGMNPGPFGMAQTGVPFGEIAAVRDWLKLHGEVGKPACENPAKPVTGFACPRSEVSGRRLWGLFAERFTTPDAFFAEHFVLNYCPLLFLDGTRNLTPDKLPAQQQTALLAACDEHLRRAVEILRPQHLVGVGAWSAKRAAAALGAQTQVRIGQVLHPSPASPAANRGWAQAATRQLQEQGIWH